MGLWRCLLPSSRLPEPRNEDARRSPTLGRRVWGVLGALIRARPLPQVRGSAGHRPDFQAGAGHSPGSWCTLTPALWLQRPEPTTSVPPLPSRALAHSWACVLFLGKRNYPQISEQPGFLLDMRKQNFEGALLGCKPGPRTDRGPRSLSHFTDGETTEAQGGDTIYHQWMELGIITASMDLTLGRTESH